MLDLSLIIVSRNVAGLLDRCLASAKGDPLWRRGGMDLLVVDNDSRDGTGEMLRERHPDARLICNRRNLGFAAAANQGIRASSGEYPVVLNPDTLLLDGALTDLLAHVRKNPGAGIVGPMVLNPDGSLQPTRRRLPGYSDILFARKSPISRLLPDNRWSRRYLMADGGSAGLRTEALGGVCLLLSREMLEAVGLFDEGYFMYMEDIDLCRRARLAGWRVDFVPEARLIHIWGASSAREKAAAEQHHRRSLYRYFLRHHAPNLFQKAYLWAALMVQSVFP
ncbi:MAG TPA: glycosyltransferase family 2 protein [candidate division Zixibacteria bacterium]|jgi:hypothetical protein|nr:glycosyltransferase family 2 protein [candidate division Zixibacteria bacterium]